MRMRHHIYSSIDSPDFTELRSQIKLNGLFAFADQLKIDFQYLTGTEINNDTKDFLRPYLHTFTSIITNIHGPLYYVRQIDKYIRDVDNLIITDLRLPSELDYLKSLDCKLYIVRVLNISQDCVKDD